MGVISATPLLELFRSQGHEFKKEGKSYKTHCPFHKDDTPSLSVEPAKGLWHCFGCGVGGDGITFLEKSLGLTFGQAADQWRELSGEEPSHRRPGNRSHPDPTRSPTPSIYKEHLTMNSFAAAPSNGTQPQTQSCRQRVLNSEDLALFRRLQDIYARDLAASDEGRAYLKERGITDPETIRAFGLGYVSGNSLPELAPAQRERLQDLGILNSRGDETFTNCIVCPLHDTEGNIITFWARCCARQVEKTSRHRCLPAQENAPFAAINWQAARGSRQVILVEGFLDALACYQAGLRNVIPLGGTACSKSGKLGFAQFLHREGVEEVLLAMDPDEAGDEGAKALAEELERRGIGSTRVRLDMDPADFFLQGGTATAFRTAYGETLGQRSDDSEFILDSHNLIYRVRALAGRQVEGRLKVHILVTSGREQTPTCRAQHRDTLNLYTHKSRKTFANTCSSRFDLGADEIEKDLEAIIQGLEERQRQKEETTTKEEPVVLSPAELEEAERYLSEPGLVRRLQDDMDALGYVGEEEAKLLVYLIATSRKLPRPLSGIIGSGSGAGKSFLAELAEQLTPPEDVVLFSKLSPQALYYLPEDYLSNKLLVLEERAGGEGADYAIRTLQSKDCLTQIVTLKDTETGQMAAKHFTVRGPIAYLETTTQSYLNQENTSRCFEIPLDESADQTRRIHQHQRKARSLWGLKRNIAKDVIRRRHHNLQRVLQPVRVVIPYAEHLTFPARYLRTRRDHERFLSLIEAVAFLHQFQRVTRTASHKGKEVKYIEATVEDYAVAYQLALRVLWVSLDELSRWGRELIESCRRQVEDGRAHQPDLKATDFHWTRRQLREYLGWPDKRLRACLDELVSLEYLQTLDGSKGKAFVYRLNPDFSHSPKALGLLTPEQLEAKLSCGRQDGPRAPNP
jgi:DNA primase